jgi:hypothetical protein
MAVKQEPGETEAAESNTKKGFDQQIVKEYIKIFNDSQKYSDGSPKPDREIWEDLGQKLDLGELTLWRYRTGKSKPSLDYIFRYIAACDDLVQFPRGRRIVNRAVARALGGIRTAKDGWDGAIPTEVEVERLRFLREWTHKRTPRSGFSVETIHAMATSEFRDLMEPLEYSPEFVAGLNRIWAGWNVAMTELAGLLSYDWLR